MTTIERFHLFWLCQAMTAPTVCAESYYYDGRNRKFFSADKDKLILFDMVDLPVLSPEALWKRMADMDSESADIVEIPRLNVLDKVAVQLSFLSNFPGIIGEETLRLEAEKQNDVAGFILDDLLNRMELLAPLVSYWDDFKFNTIRHYLEQFSGLVGITLKMF